MSANHVIDLRSFGAAAVAARIYRRKPAGAPAAQRCLALIAKATFGIVPGAALRWIAPLPIIREEKHLRDNPIASLTAASDLAFDMPGAEITLFANAAAPQGTSASSLDAGFEILRGRATLLTKRLTIVGDRDGEGAPPKPFTTIPVVYERARGGLSNAVNPVGVDLPNVLSTGGPATDAYPTGLGPIPSSWIVRRKHRGSLAAKDAYATTEVDVPDDFSAAYFAVAPPDQRLPAFDPGDVVRLVNLHPEYPTLDFGVPAIVATGAVEVEGVGRREIDLRLTSIHVEPDQLRATLTLRGSVVIDDATTMRAGVAVGLGEVTLPPLDQGEAVLDRGDAPTHTFSKAGTQILVPTAIPAVAVRAAAAAPVDHGGTVVLGDAVAPTSLPFAKPDAPKPAAKPPERAAPPGSPWTAQLAGVAPPARADLSQTVVTDQPHAASPPASSPRSESGLDRPARRMTPGRPRAAVRVLTPAPVPAAKVAEPAPVAPPSEPKPPEPPPRAEPPPPAVSAAEPAKKKSVWREDPVEAAPKPAPPKPVAVPKADISSLMYRKKR